MNPAEWARVTALFHEACEQPLADRTRWLDAHCKDAGVRAEVEAMLRAYDADPAFLEQPAEVANAVAAVITGSWAGRRIGNYRIVGEIGRGGMGVVYEARRDDDEFDRRVAIKILPSWSGSDLAHRFRKERRVLASLDHPGIARLVDSGTTDDGAPYFVMEYVDGTNIDVWCREQNLDVPARVALVQRVSDALSFAHQNLVIHRDVKPANILVTRDGQPKLLDFGIATLMTESGEAAADLTRTGHHSFTPGFASPEQVRGERVTTASDVYSLGVVLYLLLAGRLPFEIAGRPPHEALQIMCETDPPLMSAVADDARRTELRGDLDAIAAKALRPALADRYGAMAALAADLSAWSDGRPVSAVRHSSWYRASRFVRRNRKAAVASAAVMLALAGGGAATAWQARIADQERDKAQNRFREVREFSRSLLFEVHDALRTVPGATESRRLLLQRAVQFMDGLAADAGHDVELLMELTAGYQRLANVQGNGFSENLGDTAAARVSLEKAARLVETVRTFRPEDRGGLMRAISVQFDLTAVVTERSDPDARHAEERYEELVRELEDRRDLEPGVVSFVAEGYSNVGRFRTDRDEFRGAEEAYRKAIALFESLSPTDRSASVISSHAFALKRLGGVLLRAHEYDESERRYREALVLDEETIRLDDQPRTRYDITFTLSDLALVQSRRGRWDDAVGMWQRALAMRQAAVDADPKNMRATVGVATLYGRLGTAAAAQGDPLTSAKRYRDELHVRDHVIKVVGPLPVRVTEQAWARLRLAEALLASAAAAPGHASRSAWMLEAERLVRSAGRGAGKISVAAGSEPGYLELYDALSKRLAEP